MKRTEIRVNETVSIVNVLLIQVIDYIALCKQRKYEIYKLVAFVINLFHNKENLIIFIYELMETIHIVPVFNPLERSNTSLPDIFEHSYVRITSRLE